MRAINELRVSEPKKVTFTNTRAAPIDPDNRLPSGQGANTATSVGGERAYESCESYSR